LGKCVIVLAASLAVAGCADADLFAPMEQTPEALAAPRRQLSDSEKDAISQAVLRVLGDQPHRDFGWLPLVVKTGGGATDYCGLVSGDYIPGEYNITNANGEYRDYYAQLTFDGGGALSKVNVVAIGDSMGKNVPTKVESTCMQSGYLIRQWSPGPAGDSTAESGRLSTQPY
jgi:hypothetical protein